MKRNGIEREINYGKEYNTVSDAMSYLIYTNKFPYQVYGFVFDEHGKVVAEGEHYGRSVEDARIKQKEQAAFFERKFGF